MSGPRIISDNLSSDLEELVIQTSEIQQQNAFFRREYDVRVLPSYCQLPVKVNLKHSGMLFYPRAKGGEYIV